MFKLMLFEGKKMFKSTFFRIMLGIFLLFILGYYVFIHINTIRVDEMVLEAESSMSVAQSELDEMEAAIEAGELDAEDDEVIMRKEQLENSVMEEELKLEYYEKENWAGIMQMEVDNNETFVENRLVRGDWSTAKWPSLFTDVSKLKHDKWLFERGLKPVFPINNFSWETNYDNYFEPPDMEEFVMDFSQKYSSSGVYFIHHIFGLIFSVFGAVFFLFLFGDVVTKEGTVKNGSIQFLRTQPLHRDKILISKFLSVIFVSLLILLCLVLTSLLLGTIFDRFGDWNYPVLIYGEDYNFTFMNMGTYLLQSFILFFMLLLFTYSLLFFFSVLTKRGLVAVGLTLAVIFIGIEISAESVLSPLAAYVPFHYFSVSDVMTQELALAADNFSFTFENGVMLLGVSSLVLMCLTYVFSVFEYRYWRN